MKTAGRLICIVLLLACINITIAADSPQDKIANKYIETITTKDGNKISFEMVPIPKGSFLMGSPQDEAGRKDNEGPQHKISLDSFYLCSTETTLELFLAYYQETVSAKKDFFSVQDANKNAQQPKTNVDAMTSATPVWGDMTMGYSKQHPAIGMTWHNAMAFCKWLSKKTGTEYRLPTEAEWEYACRAGTSNIYGVTNDPCRIQDFAWYKDTSEIGTSAVAKKKSNPWGLYDMQGNVNEWVYDFYSPAAYKEDSQQETTVNPKGPKTGTVHVARGGSYSSSVEEIRCAARNYEEEFWRWGDPQIPKSVWWLPSVDFIGVRVARSLDSNDVNTGMVFIPKSNGEYTFNTGVLRGKLRREGQSFGLSSLTHIPTGRKLDNWAGILGYYRFFTTNKRYGVAGYDWPSTSKLLSDGSVEVTWSDANDRPFETTAVYHWREKAVLELTTIVKAKQQLPNFEIFLASYFDPAFPKPYIYVSKNPQAQDKPGFILAERSLGFWQMYPKKQDAAAIIQDGRWQKQPSPVDWVVMPTIEKPICFRRGEKDTPTLILMTAADECFAVSTPFVGELHESLYMSLFGRDIKAAETATAHSIFIVAENISDQEIPGLYEKYMKVSKLQKNSRNNP